MRAGESYRDIADDLGVPRSTVSDRVQRRRAARRANAAENIQQAVLAPDPMRALIGMGGGKADDPASFAEQLGDAMEECGLTAGYLARKVRDLCDAKTMRGKPDWRMQEKGMQLALKLRGLLGGEAPPERKPPPPVLVLSTDQAKMFAAFTPDGEVPQFFRTVDGKSEPVE